MTYNKIEIIKRFTFLFISFLAFIIILNYQPQRVSSHDYDFIKMTILVILFVVVMHILLNSDRNYFRIDIIFILGFLIVHFQWPVMLAVSGIEPRGFSELFTNQSYMNYGVWLSAIGILSWIIGYNLRFENRLYYFIDNKSSSEGLNGKCYYYCPRLLRFFNWVIFSVFLIAAGPSFITGAVYKSAGSAEAVSGVAGYIYTIFHVSLIAQTAVEIYVSKFNKSTGIFSFGLTLNKNYVLLATAYCLIFLVAGDRGGPLQLVIAYLLLYSSLIRRVSFKTFFILVVFSSIFLTFVGFARAGNINQFGSEQSSSVYDTTLSLASSARTIYLGLYQVPNNEEYFYGKLWLGSILGIIPMLQGAYIEISGDKPYYINSANYITYLRYGENPHTGEGSSLIIDIYLNFGSFGVIFFLSLLGYFTRVLQINLMKCVSINYVALAALFGCTMFYISRATLFVPLQIIMWGLFFIFIFVKKKACK